MKMYNQNNVLVLKINQYDYKMSNIPIIFQLLLLLLK